jgi:hypothetical protein
MFHYAFVWLYLLVLGAALLRETSNDLKHSASAWA